MAANESSGQAEAPRTELIALAWGAIVISTVPTIVLHLLVPGVPAEPLTPYWLAWATVVALAALWAVASAWPAVKPLRGFVLLLLAFKAADSLILPLAFESAAWSNWVAQLSWGAWLVAGLGFSRLVMVALTALTLIGSTIGRRELFLVRGNPSAPAQPTRLLALREPRPWDRVARGWLPYYAIIVLIVGVMQVRPDVSQIARALIFLPAIIIGAVINAFGEEFVFRSMPLSRLEPVVGPGQAIVMAGGLFGLRHYFGTPGGPFGVMLAAYLGWLAAKSMIETRGLVWAFSIHFVGNFIVYAFWAMAGVMPVA